MLIECENCNKKFELDSNLIPENGRELQCGSCEHIWFYKKNINILEKKEIIDDQNINIEKKQIKKEIKKVKKNLKENEKNKKEYSIYQKIEKKDYNILKIFLVLIITFIAIIIIVDIDNNNIELTKFKGKPILLVNTASRCGFTPQYQGLQNLFLKYLKLA